MLQEKKGPSSNPEMWGGIECTINRVNDSYTDQLMSAGHYSRHSDIRQLARLGIRALRYPILWERHQPDRSAAIDWSWTSRQLDAIRSYNITPLAGLLHHGSGPAYTDLGSSDFPVDFAKYARQVAARFPWIEYYTPINEPLTTARFSGLYGIWYPHQKNARLFINMLLKETKGIVFAMKAIRTVNPGAKLIQTEDLAKIHSTPLLTYQRDFENHRRWLTFDLLTGRVDKAHPLWDYLRHLGVEEKELTFFIDNPCCPDILGVNYYVTSERFLDENIAAYPGHAAGGNGIHTYADIEAVRSVSYDGLGSLLQETWERYHIPIAITEAHLNCTREEQMRWLKEVYDTACQAKKAGMEIIAVTAWALLGAHDWNSLLSRNDRHYESGAYEIRENELHLTALGDLIAALSAGHDYCHPLLKQKGWWRRHDGKGGEGPHTPHQVLLLMGPDDRANQLLRDICRSRGICFISALYSPDRKDPVAYVENMIRSVHPWGLLSISGGPPGTKYLPAVCKRQGIPFMTIAAGLATTEKEVNRQLDLFIDITIAHDRTYKKTKHIFLKKLSTI